MSESHWYYIHLWCHCFQLFSLLNFCCKDANHQGEPAIAAGWGRCVHFHKILFEIISITWTKLTFGLRTESSTGQSPMLKRVNLMVSMRNFNRQTIIGTELRQNSNGDFEDPCAGDSGGPLMYEDTSSQRWTLIGQINFIALLIQLLRNWFFKVTFFSNFRNRSWRGFWLQNG